MILVTGSTGNVGRPLVGLLEKRGEKVRALSRDPEHAHLPDGVEVIAADLARPDALSPALDGVDRVFLLVNIPGDPAQVTTFCAALAGRDVRHVVFLSSFSVEADVEGDTIADIHRAAEATVIDAVPSWTMLRPGTFFSNTLAWADGVRAEGIVRSTHGNDPVAPVDERDVAAVAACALTESGHEHRTYPLTGPEKISPEDQSRVLAEVLGREIGFAALPYEVVLEHVTGLVGDRATAEGILRGVRGADVPWSDPLPTVEQLTGRPARTYREWAVANADRFR
jgi:uncharacterized protein YbjT (DUF2867 family)